MAPFIFGTLLHLEMIKPAKIMTLYTLQSQFLLTFHWLKKRCKHAVQLMFFGASCRIMKSFCLAGLMCFTVVLLKGLCG